MGWLDGLQSSKGELSKKAEANERTKKAEFNSVRKMVLGLLTELGTALFSDKGSFLSNFLSRKPFFINEGDFEISIRESSPLSRRYEFCVTVSISNNTFQVRAHVTTEFDVSDAIQFNYDVKTDSLTEDSLKIALRKVGEEIARHM